MMFLKEQGYEIKGNVVFQYNKIYNIMEMNGRNLCTGNSRYINVRYFFVKYRIDKNEVKVKYCPANLVLVDCFCDATHGGNFQGVVLCIDGV